MRVCDSHLLLRLAAYPRLLVLTAMLVGVAQPILAQDRVGIGRPVTLRSGADGIRLSGAYPIGDFSLELEIAYRDPGSVLSAWRGPNPPDGAWSLAILADGHLRFQVWDRGAWQSLTSSHALRPGTSSVVRLLRSGWVTRFVFDAPEAAATPLPVQLSGSDAYVGGYRANGVVAVSPDEASAVGTITVRHFGPLRMPLGEAELVNGSTAIASGDGRAEVPSGTRTDASRGNRTAAGREAASSADRAAAPRAGPAPGRLLQEQLLSPSGADQTVAYGDLVRVTVPAGVLSTRAALRIAEAPPLPPPPARLLKPGAEFDIAIGTQHEFRQDLTIELRYDPARLPARIPAANAMIVMSWDPEQEIWMSERTSVDTARQVVVVRTNHLSAKRLHYVDELGWILTSEHFHLLYDRSAKGELTQAATTVVRPDGSRRKVGQSIRSVPMDSIAKLVSDALEHSWAAYAEPAMGFTMPSVPRRSMVYFEPGSDAPYKAKLSNDLFFPTSFVDSDYASSQAQIEHEAAHEYFHVVQNQYWRFVNMYRRKWWIEATADYAASAIAWRQPGRMARVPIDYFRLPILTVDGKHEYKTARLVDHLVRSRAEFKSLWDAVAAGGTDIPPDISTWLRGARRSSFEQEFRAWVATVLFDANGPLSPTYNNGQAEVPSMPEGLYMSRAVDRRAVLTIPDSQVTESFPMLDAYTAGVWGVRVRAAAGTRRLLRVERTGNTGPLLPVDAYVLRNDVRPAGGVRSAGGVERPGTSLLLPPVSDNDVLYLINVNAGNGGFGETPLRVFDAFRVHPSRPSLVGGSTQQFTIPGITERVIWSVLEGAAGGTITAAGLYRPPNRTGTFHVVATLDRDRAVTAQVTVQVAENRQSGVERTTGLYFGIGAQAKTRLMRPAVGFPATSYTRPPDIETSSFPGQLEWSGNAFTYKSSKRDNLSETTVEATGSFDATGRNLLSMTVSLSMRLLDQDPWNPGRPGVTLDVSYTVRNLPLLNIVDDSFQKKKIFYLGGEHTVPHLTGVKISKYDAWHTADEYYEFAGWMDPAALSLTIYFTQPLSSP